MSDQNKKQAANPEQELANALARIDELELENQDLKTALENAQKTGVAAMPIAGSFSIEVEAPNNAKKKSKKTFRFKAGRSKVVIDNGQRAASVCVLKLANGEKLSEKELTENPVLQGFTQERAEQLMLKYISMQAGFLEEVQ